MLVILSWLSRDGWTVTVCSHHLPWPTLFSPPFLFSDLTLNFLQVWVKETLYPTHCGLWRRLLKETKRKFYPQDKVLALSAPRLQWFFYSKSFSSHCKLPLPGLGSCLSTPVAQVIPECPSICLSLSKYLSCTCETYGGGHVCCWGHTVCHTFVKWFVQKY
jgi:hypothetical protein